MLVQEDIFLNRIIIDITNSCNLRCIMCGYDHNSQKIQMPTELFAKIARQSFQYTKEVCLSCGYEAFTADNFLEILENLKGPFNSVIITNGTLLNKSNIAKIIQVGLGQIIISFDGARKETFEKIRKGACFEKVVSNIQLLNSLKKELGSAKPEICFTTVLMRSNIEEFPAIIQQADQLGIRSMVCKSLAVKSPEMETEALEKHRDLAISCLAEGIKLAEKLKIKMQLSPDLAKFIKQDNADIVPEEKDKQKVSKSSKCGDSLFIMLVSPDGKVYPCSRWHGESVGDFNDQSFQQIWDSEDFKKLRSQIISGNFSEGCLKCSYFS